MSEIVPRWEWRSFGETFSEAESTFAPLSPERVQDSDEVYVLSRDGTDAVEVRDDRMDIKHLGHVNDDGLEQWIPVMKAESRCPRLTSERVLDALRAGDRSSKLSRTAYTMRELLDEVVAASPDLLAVNVHKTRTRYAIGGCMAETEVRTRQASTRTIEIESQGSIRVIATVTELGLAQRPNVSFARGLKSLLGLWVETYAVIDLGTHSVKFHIGQRLADGTWRKLVDRAESLDSARDGRRPDLRGMPSKSAGISSSMSLGGPVCELRMTVAVPRRLSITLTW